MYDYLDSVLKKLIRAIRATFQNYRALPFDELNTLQAIHALYEELQRLNLEAYRDIALYYYRIEAKNGIFPEERLMEILRTPSAVLKYSYDSEVVRKRDRLVEASIATKGNVSEYDKAMRYWVMLTGWISIEIADAAMAQAREDIGIERVMWKAEHDLRTCSLCHRLDGKIFTVKTIPLKPHPGCRCWLEDVK